MTRLIGAGVEEFLQAAAHGGCSKVLVKKGPSGIHFVKKGIPTKQGTYIIMAIFGTGILNNYHMFHENVLVAFEQLENTLPEGPHVQPLGNHMYNH